MCYGATMSRKEASNDIRVQKTLERIHDAFRVLVENKEFSRLTVSALCKEAKIGRKTFYTYYDSLDDLLKESIERMATEYIERIKEYRGPEDIFEITRQFYLFSTEKGKFYDNLVCSESYQAIGGHLLMRFVRDTWNCSPWFRSLEDEEQELLLCFIYNSGASLYRHWIISGKRISLDRMIDLAYNLVGKGIEGIKNSISQHAK